MNSTAIRPLSIEELLQRTPAVAASMVEAEDAEVIA